MQVKITFLHITIYNVSFKNQSQFEQHTLLVYIVRHFQFECRRGILACVRS
nr:MAG TPA: hypothetical protein [Caudoviricetes sp.]